MKNNQTPSCQSSNHPLSPLPPSPQSPHPQPLPPAYRESIFSPDTTSASPSKSLPSPKRHIRRLSTKTSKPKTKNSSSASIKHRPISRIKNLTPHQLDQLAAWHLRDGLSIEACATRATAEFNPPRPIPKTSVQRFLQHRRTADFLKSQISTLESPPNPLNPVNPVKSQSIPSVPTPESLHAAATELNFYAATASVNFSPATLHLLEQKAFQLTQNFQPLNPQDPRQLHHLNQQLAPLKNLWLLIHKAKNTAIRERHASVQEEKCVLRRDELKARQIEADVRERQKQHHLDLARDKFEFQKQQAQQKSTSSPTQNSTPKTQNSSSPSSSASSASSRALCVDSSPTPPKDPNATDPNAHIKGNNYWDKTNNKIWTLAADTPVLPFTDTAMEHRDRRNPLPPVDHSVSAAVQDYADRAAQDYIQYLADPPRPRPAASTDYDYYRKRIRGCPCGQPKFCDRHIFIALFSYAHPWSHAFRQCLLDRGLPYLPPTIPFPGNKPNI